MHHAHNVHIGLAVFLTNCCFFVFCVWRHLREQPVSVAPIWDSAPSGCTMVLMPCHVSDKLVCFCVFFVWSRMRQQNVSVAPFLQSAPSGCTTFLRERLVPHVFLILSDFFVISSGQCRCQQRVSVLPIVAAHI